MKKFLCFFFATIVLILMVAYMGVKYIIPNDYPVFIESFDHGIITVENDSAIGNDKKFELFCRYGEKVTININPERSGKVYYNLEKLTNNGVDVTDQVNMLEYTFTVEGKTTILAYFSKSKSGTAATQTSAPTILKAPEIFTYAENEYLGSANAYDIEDPSIIFDEESGYYYCFATGNVVMRSDDLHNWEKRTNYFKIPEGAENNSIMAFSQFSSVQSWAKEHGYNENESSFDLSNNRAPTAPDIIKVGTTYYLYYSLSKESNANESAIFCVKTDNLADAVENQSWSDAGMVICSCGRNSDSSEEYSYDAANAVHPAVFTDGEGKRLFMAYGSSYGRQVIKGSIHLIELEPISGLLKTSSSITSAGETIATLHGSKTYTSGVKIADPGRIPALTRDDGSLVSACDVIFNSTTGYYYLFVTYGVSDTNYEIRVARSKDVEGPYLDMDGNDMSSFGKSNSNDMYEKGTPVAAGYNFSMSSGGGVSYTDVGRASIGAPSIIKLTDGKWLMASQSRAYYKIDGAICCGDAIAAENEYDAATKSALELRQLYFKFEWPMAMPETYDGETVGAEFTKTELYGNWDVLIFDGSEPSPDYDSVVRYTSQKVSLLDVCAITQTQMDKGSELNSASFKKESATNYKIVLDGITYQCFPVILWDNELDTEVIALTGLGDDGSVLWAKKAFSPYMGIYLEAFEYLTSIAPSGIAEKYKAKLEKISDNPTQEQIDSFSRSMVKEILESSENK